MRAPDKQTIQRFLLDEKLPPDFAEVVDNWYLPLAQRLLGFIEQSSAPPIIGINGAQGTGKSTLAGFLSLMFQQHNLRVANLSLDDFYLDGARRQALARDVHPLLASRGVPGTHDLALARNVLDALADPHASGSLQLPRFDKSIDEPLPTEDWESFKLPADAILLEGWFTGVTPQQADQLVLPVNELEAAEDPDGRWRAYVNQALSDYQPLFNRIDYLIMLKAPSFNCVYNWRHLQEKKLAERAGTDNNRVMDQASLNRFIQHFERLTRHCLVQLPGSADLVFHLDETHHITSMSQAVH